MAVSSTCRGLLGELNSKQQFHPVVTVPRTVNMSTALSLVDGILLHKIIDSRVRQVAIDCSFVSRSRRL